MSQTLASSVIAVRSLINEHTASFWSDTEIENWIKEATIDISCKLLSYEVSGTITLITDKWIYNSANESWLGDLIRVKGCYYDGTGGAISGIQRIDIQKFGHLQVTDGQPRYFFENNRIFYVWPIPTASENSKTIEVLHSSETDDVTDLRDEHQPFVVLYAAAKSKAKDRLFQESNLYMTQYLNSINFERQDKYNFGIDPTTRFSLD